MECAHHVITRIMNPRFLSYMASYDVASAFLCYMASYDVASAIHQSLPH